jgi:hypothetical protein
MKHFYIFYKNYKNGDSTSVKLYKLPCVKRSSMEA